MKFLKWCFIGCEHKVTKEDKALRRIVKKLYKACKKYGIQHSDIYVLCTDGCTTLNIRAKRKEEVIVNSYAFIRKEI